MEYKRCSHCGVSNRMENMYCSNCGQVFKNMLSQQEATFTSNSKNSKSTTANGVHKAGTSTTTVTRNRDQKEQSDKKADRGNKKGNPVFIVGGVVVALALLVTAFFTIHTWTDVTCTEASECKICGKIRQQPLGHNWIDATHSTPQTCSICGVTEGDPLTVEPIYLNELGVMNGHEGKVWTRSETAPVGTHHTKADIGSSDNKQSCWEDWIIPGHTTGVVKDNNGNVYTYGIFIDGKGTDIYYMEFYLGGKYTKFTGTCACPDQEGALSNRVYDKSLKQDKYFEVYLDGRFAGQSPIMRYDFAAQQFEFDVTGVNILRILYPATKGPSEVASIYDGLLS